VLEYRKFEKNGLPIPRLFTKSRKYSGWNSMHAQAEKTEDAGGYVESVNRTGFGIVFAVILLLL
jgi:hypothetical protein